MIGELVSRSSRKTARMKKLPQRFIFRQVDYRDLRMFVNDGVIRAKNHPVTQKCHQTSYVDIVNRRGTAVYPMPCGGVVNDYVPFYFSPLTSFTYTISMGNVNVISPSGRYLGDSSEDDRIFFVGRPEKVREAGLTYCFSNIALNASAPVPVVEQNLDNLETHINWAVFDEQPLKGSIAEIGYSGACMFFKDDARQGRMNRSSERMAEFLVKGQFPLSALDCIVVKSSTLREALQPIIDASNLDLPIYDKKDCYWK